MSIDARTLRHTVGQFATGVTVVSTEVDGSVHAMTANSFTSLSLDPPLVLFCVGKHTKAGQLIHQAGGFCVNILQETQRDQSTYFAGGWKEADPPPFSFEEWHGTPRLAGSAAALGCQLHAIHEGGDHWIVVGHVLAVHRVEADVRPLVYFRGRYAALDCPAAS
jgi:3-hydroxy-9,10-secoandrosta-1,3,5(10)-triene-9,17-dione monooxygenase reductase component